MMEYADELMHRASEATDEGSHFPPEADVFICPVDATYECAICHGKIIAGTVVRTFDLYAHGECIG